MASCAGKSFVPRNLSRSDLVNNNLSRIIYCSFLHLNRHKLTNKNVKIRYSCAGTKARLIALRPMPTLKRCLAQLVLYNRFAAHNSLKDRDPFFDPISGFPILSLLISLSLRKVESQSRKRSRSFSSAEASCCFLLRPKTKDPSQDPIHFRIGISALKDRRSNLFPSFSLQLISA